MGRSADHALDRLTAPAGSRGARRPEVILRGGTRRHADTTASVAPARLLRHEDGPRREYAHEKRRANGRRPRIDGVWAAIDGMRTANDGV